MRRECFHCYLPGKSEAREMKEVSLMEFFLEGKGVGKNFALFARK